MTHFLAPEMVDGFVMICLITCCRIKLFITIFDNLCIGPLVALPSFVKSQTAKVNSSQNLVGFAVAMFIFFWVFPWLGTGVAPHWDSLLMALSSYGEE